MSQLPLAADESAAEDPGSPTDLDLDLELELDGERREASVAAAEHGQRLDRWLVLHHGAFSRSHLQSLIDAGQVRIDGLVQSSASQRVRAGQRVAVLLLPTLQSQAFRPQAMPLAVVYEDEHMLVIDKAPGIVVHPAPGNWSGTLLNGLLAHHHGAAQLPRAGIVHRLDKDTSGLMVVAKTLPAMTALTRAIAAREVHREYLALAHGELRQAAFTVEAAIGRDPVVRVKMAVVAGGKPARTDVRLLATHASVSAVLCTLHTGRTHQIRVHLASRGHALVGDTLYGGRAALGLERQALHAWRLGLAHPADGRPLRFEAPLEARLLEAWKQIGAALPL